MKKLFVLLFPVFLWASITSIDQKNIELCNNTYILNENISINEALNSQNFFKVPNLLATLRYKFSRNFWIKIPLKNTLNEPLKKTLLINWKNANLSIYYKNKQTLSGPYEKSDLENDGIIYEHFTLYPNEQKDIYIKVNEHPILDNFNSIYISNQSSYIKTISQHERIYNDGFFFGILLCILFCGLILYASTGLKSYLYYVFFVISILSIISSLKWYIFPYFQGQLKYVAFLLNHIVPITFSTLSLALFTGEFFELKRYHPYINRYVQAYIVFVLLSAIDLFFTPANQILSFYPVLLLPSFVFIGLILYKNHGISALFYATSIFIFTLPMFLHSLTKTFKFEFCESLYKMLQISGTVASIILSFATLIKLKEIIKERREFEQQVCAKSRFEAMGEMIGNIAHQWRQPLSHLSSIFMHLEIHDKLGKLTSPLLQNKTKEANLQITHMSNTIEDFRNFFSKNKEKQEFNLSEIVNASLKFMKVSLENNGIHTSIEILKDCKVNTYQNELLQVLVTIITNAKDALKDRPEDNRQIVLKVFGKMIIVSDNAGGINESILSKIFEPYFTTKLNKNGTGLGLYMARAIIENNIGGKIYASNTNDGAKFTLEIP